MTTQILHPRRGLGSGMFAVLPYGAVGYLSSFSFSCGECHRRKQKVNFFQSLVPDVGLICVLHSVIDKCRVRMSVVSFLFQAK